MKPRTPRFSHILLACSVAGASFGSVSPLSAQSQADSVRIELARLAALVDSLSREVARLRAADQPAAASDALADLRAAAAAAAAAGGAPEPTPQGSQSFVGRERALQSLNPEISLNADVFAQVDPDAPGTENFFAREFELSIKSSLDPYSRASIAITRESPGGEVEPFADGTGEEEAGGGLDVEEGYVEWVSLPGGFGVKLGKFFQRFGTLNRWHSHALPFQSRSLPHLAFLGEGALAQTGLSASWLAPFGGTAGTYEATVELTRSENEALFGSSNGLSVLTHVNAFWTLGDASDLDLALSWITGDYESDTEAFTRNAYNAELSFNWTPPARSRQRGLSARVGYMMVDRLDTPVGPTPMAVDRETAGGLWSTVETRLSPAWLVGARFDRTENPAAPDVTQWLASPTLTWWQSEFVRVRLEYDFLSGLSGGDGSGRFLVQTTFAMGPHKHSTY